MILINVRFWLQSAGRIKKKSSLQLSPHCRRNRDNLCSCWRSLRTEGTVDFRLMGALVAVGTALAVPITMCDSLKGYFFTWLSLHTWINVMATGWFCSRLELSAAPVGPRVECKNDFYQLKISNHQGQRCRLCCTTPWWASMQHLDQME